MMSLDVIWLKKKLCDEKQSRAKKDSNNDIIEWVKGHAPEQVNQQDLLCLPLCYKPLLC